jgi:hypothetical protein
MTTQKFTHPSVEERRAEDKDAQAPTSPSSHTKWVPRGPARPGGSARRAERHWGVGPDAGAARPDDGLAVHLYRGAARIMAAGPKDTPWPASAPIFQGGAVGAPT